MLKRGMDEDAVATVISDTIIEDVMFFAFSVVRLSGVANMFDANAVCTYVMCVLALWGRSDLAKGLNERATYAEVSKAWRNGFSENRERWESGAAGMPLGRDYPDALRRYPDTVSPKLKSYEMFKDHHNHDDDPDGWAQNMVEHARRLCLQAGMFARDTVKIERLRTVFDDAVLTRTAAISGIIRP